MLTALHLHLWVKGCCLSKIANISRKKNEQTVTLSKNPEFP